MPNLLRRYQNIESEFFELDQENKKALMKLEFDKPSSIFDKNAVTKIPVLSDEFLSWIIASFEYAPKNYKIDLDIAFEDMENYNGEELKEIFFKNLILEAKRIQLSLGI